MSKLGRKPIQIPENVKVEYNDSIFKATGPKGTLEFPIKDKVNVKFDDNQIKLSIEKFDKISKSYYGLTRAQIANMMKGITDGFSINLELIGVGFRAEIKGNKIILNIGFSHPVEIEIPDGLDVNIEKNKIMISGINKQMVGQLAAKIRANKKPEPYKGKGIKYENEIIRRKAGKVVAKAEGAKKE